eukprot:123932-Pelagomonas_calceolata.AAC.4
MCVKIWNVCSVPTEHLDAFAVFLGPGVSQIPVYKHEGLFHTLNSCTSGQAFRQASAVLSRAKLESRTFLGWQAAFA